MIQASSSGDTFQTAFTNGRQAAYADIPLEKGGDGNGFGPHELLEAALATCMAISVHKFAAQRGYPVSKVTIEVVIDRSSPKEVRLLYSLQADGSLAAEQIREMWNAASECPVGRTLAGEISLESTMPTASRLYTP